MIVILKKDPDPDQLEGLIAWLEDQHITVRPTVGTGQTILGLVGDTASIDQDMIAALDIVDEVKRVQEPYKNVNRKFHPEDTVIEVGGVRIGGGRPVVIAGPGAVESREQILTIALAAAEKGADLLYGGAFMTRTSPYAFAGLREEGIRYLVEAGHKAGLPVVSEISDDAQMSCFEEVDILLVSAANMQNYQLLSLLGRLDRPVILTRGFSASYEEFLMAAEYIMAGGNDRVILSESGIRSFENYTRTTLDITAVPVMKKLSHLPVIVDPSRAVKKAYLVPPMAAAAVSAGADGLFLEVHHDPSHARFDGSQSITPETLGTITRSVSMIKEAGITV